jgi:DNA-binding NtrC family response regulator
LLVIDADDELRDVYASHFARSGFDVHCAATIAEAASLLENVPFDAVIADLREGPSYGPAIAGWLDRARDALRVVVLTAYGEPEWATEAARLRVDAFLHKPVSLVWLEQLLKTRIDEARLHGESGPVAAAG